MAVSDRFVQVNGLRVHYTGIGGIGRLRLSSWFTGWEPRHTGGMAWSRN